MKTLKLLLFCFAVPSLSAQINCNAYLFYGDTSKFHACIQANKVEHHYQFEKIFHEILDTALMIDSTYAYAYREKSVAYLKSGDFITWKKLIDRAVKFDSIGNLGYRAWCRYQFFRDYQGCIDDIEKLESLTKFDIGFGANGAYHLITTKALCYRALKQTEKSIKILEEFVLSKDYFENLYDYLHLGVSYLEVGKIDSAISYLIQQEGYNDIAENNYYMSLCLIEINQFEKAKKYAAKALEKYNANIKLYDPYTAIQDCIYRSDILELQNKIEHLSIN